MRKGKDTPVSEVEQQAKELLNQHASPEQQGQIYCHLALVYSESGLSHPELVIGYAQRALQFPLEPHQRLRLHTYLGDALRVANRGKKPFTEIRRMAAISYLEGLNAAEEYDIPQQRPEMPMAGFNNVPTNDPDYKRIQKETGDKIQAQERARSQQDLWDDRHVLTRQIVDMYTRRPRAATELRQLATKVLKNPAMVDGLMKLIADKGALKDDPIEKKQKTLKGPPPSGRSWRPVVIVFALPFIVALSTIIWLRRRRHH